MYLCCHQAKVSPISFSYLFNDKKVVSCVAMARIWCHLRVHLCETVNIDLVLTSDIPNLFVYYGRDCGWSLNMYSK